MSASEEISILFVCMGNICRSPMAEGVFRHFIEREKLTSEIKIDSAGTHAFHKGNIPDYRAEEVALKRGYSLEGITARRIVKEDFLYFDLILPMDMDNLNELKNSSKEKYHNKMRLILDYSDNNSFSEVPDPYYGGSPGFERALDLIEEASKGLLIEMKKLLLENNK